VKPIVSSEASEDGCASMAKKSRRADACVDAPS
jgi:hypothetical protein